MQRIRNTAALAVALTVAGTVVSAFGASASSTIGAPTTIVAIAKFSHAAFVDARPAGLSAGDQQVVAGRLLQGGRQIGAFGFTCEFLRGGAGAQEDCSGTGRLGGGQITLHGFSAQASTSHVWAITGGTGVYANARGQVLITDIDPTTSRVTVQVTP